MDPDPNPGQQMNADYGSMRLRIRINNTAKNNPSLNVKVTQDLAEKKLFFNVWDKYLLFLQRKSLLTYVQLTITSQN
jgi:hypothetical protein